PGSEEYAQALYAGLPEVSGFEAVIGSGVQGTVEGKSVFVGSRVIVDGQDVGGFKFEDEPKPDAKEAISALRDHFGIRTYMVTGDAKAPAYAVAREVGITDQDVFYGV
ncbi:MAG: HAD family hydrolase, partial [Eggerthellaceae bacterium]|nr:HAD family hydrolase [Eggerthellaceae bacterium]